MGKKIKSGGTKKLREYLLFGAVVLLVVFGLFFAVNYSAVQEPPHKTYSKAITGTSGTLRFSEIEYLDQVYKIEVVAKFCHERNDIWGTSYTDLATQNTYLLPGISNYVGISCDNLNFGGMQQYATSVLTYTPTNFDGTVKYEIFGKITERTGVITTDEIRLSGDSIINIYEEVECVVDSDCSHDRVCQDNLCGFPVYIEQDCNELGCPDGYTCDSEGGYCIRTEYITLDCDSVGCPDGYACENGVCVGNVYIVRDCTDLGCPEGYSCNDENGYCVKTEYQYRSCTELGCPEGYSCEVGEDDEPVCVKDWNWALIIAGVGLIVLAFGIFWVLNR